MKIGFLGPLQTEYIDAGLKAVQLAVDEINRAGGVLGKKVEIAEILRGVMRRGITMLIA